MFEGKSYRSERAIFEELPKHPNAQTSFFSLNFFFPWHTATLLVVVVAITITIATTTSTSTY